MSNNYHRSNFPVMASTVNGMLDRHRLSVRLRSEGGGVYGFTHNGNPVAPTVGVYQLGSLTFDGWLALARGVEALLGLVAKPTTKHGFDLTVPARDLRQVNALLAKCGLPVRAVAGRGYYYWKAAKPPGYTLEAAGNEYTYRASQLTLGQWLELAEVASGAAAAELATA